MLIINVFFCSPGFPYPSSLVLGTFDLGRALAV